MKKNNRIGSLSILLVLAYLMNACSGAPAAQNVDTSNSQPSQGSQLNEVVFTGTVDAIGADGWTVSGQTIKIDSSTSVEANVVVGDNVKVEAQVAQDGAVTAVRIELSGPDDANSNTNTSNENESNANDNASNSNGSQDDNSNSSNDNGNGNDQEVSGVVEAITTDSITIDGVTYSITDLTEFKDLIGVGDQVKVHVIVNPDGTLTISEIEKSDDTTVEDGNSNSNGSDDNSNVNSNGDDSSDNGNDDSGSDNQSNDNGDDSGGGDNGNDSNSNGNG